MTTEKVFYAHNPSLVYRHGVAERALDCVRTLAAKLVPKHRILDNSNVCPLSITVINLTSLNALCILLVLLFYEFPMQKMYLEIGREPSADDYFKENLKTGETELLLADLADCTRRLQKGRIFGWSSSDSILYSSCYNTMVSMIDDIMFRITNIDMDSKNKEWNYVLRTEVREKLRKKKMRELGMKVRLSEVPVTADGDNTGSSPFLYLDEVIRVMV